MTGQYRLHFPGEYIQPDVLDELNEGTLDLALGIGAATEPLTTCATCNRTILQRDAERDNCDDYCSRACMTDRHRY